MPIVINLLPVNKKPVKDINFATVADATRVAESLKAQYGDIDITISQVPYNIGGAPNIYNDGALSLMIYFALEMSWKNEFGRDMVVSVPFSEPGGEMVDRLDSNPSGMWKNSIAIGSNPPIGDMERA